MAAREGGSGGGGGGGGQNNDNGDDLTCVYRLIATGATVQWLRRVIEASAPSEEGRRRAVNASVGGETPLQATRRLKRVDLAVTLLEAGADASQMDLGWAVELCIHDGLVGTLRTILQKGGVDINKPICCGCCPVHICIRPPDAMISWASPGAWDPWGLSRFPLLGFLEVLVREFGADINGRNWSGETPLHLLLLDPNWRCERALDKLVELGADIDAVDKNGETALHHAAKYRRKEALLLLARGASANVVSKQGATPLMCACQRPADAELISALVRASSPETRRARDSNGWSAVDHLVSDAQRAKQPWRQQPIADLLRSGATVLRRHQPRVLPVIARWGVSLEPRVAALPPMWEVHEAMVGLAFDFAELREADEAVRARERRVAELEEELRALGVGTEDTEEEEEDDDEEEEEEEDESGGGEGGSKGGSGSAASGGDEDDEREGAAGGGA